MKGYRIGYIRVSTFDQNPERQLENVDLDKKFIDHASGRDSNRPQLVAMLDFAREGDLIIVHSMDRLARNLRDLRKIVDQLTAKGVSIEFMKENLKFNGQDSSMSNLLLSIMGAFAEFEYAFIKERQMEGITIAKREGRFKGRQRKLKADQMQLLKDNLNNHKTKSELARELGISRQTYYKYEKEVMKNMSTSIINPSISQ